MTEDLDTKAVLLTVLVGVVAIIMLALLLHWVGIGDMILDLVSALGEAWRGER